MKLFIGCSSSDEISSEYMNECTTLLEELFSRENDLVFGANNTGLMGIAHDCALKNGRSIIGICPEIYKDDFKKLKCNKEIVARTVGERTEKVILESDVLIFLPGGMGTVYELLTAIETKREHEHDKPIIIFNSNNYFDKLLSTFEKIYTENFTSRKVEMGYIVFNSVNDVLEYIERYKGEVSV